MSLRQVNANLSIVHSISSPTSPIETMARLQPCLAVPPQGKKAKANARKKQKKRNKKLLAQQRHHQNNPAAPPGITTNGRYGAHHGGSEDDDDDVDVDSDL